MKPRLITVASATLLHIVKTEIFRRLSTCAVASHRKPVARCIARPSTAALDRVLRIRNETSLVSRSVGLQLARGAASETSSVNRPTSN